MSWTYWFIAFIAAAGWGTVVWLALKLEAAEARIAELLAQPLSYWKHRDTMARLLRGTINENRKLLAALGDPRPFPPSDPGKVVTFRRPQPFAMTRDEPRPGVEL